MHSDPSWKPIQAIQSTIMPYLCDNLMQGVLNGKSNEQIFLTIPRRSCFHWWLYIYFILWEGSETQGGVHKTHKTPPHLVTLPSLWNLHYPCSLNCTIMKDSLITFSETHACPEESWVKIWQVGVWRFHQSSENT